MRENDYDLDRCAVCAAPIHPSQAIQGVCLPCLAVGERARHAAELRAFRNQDLVACVVVGGAR